MGQYDFAGKVAVVTGAASGIGFQVMRALLENGARVAALDSAPVPASALPENIRSRAYPLVADVRSSQDVDGAIARIEQELGPVDFGVNVAGIFILTPVITTTDATWSDVFAVNATGVFNVSRALARRMVPRRSGALVTVSSNAAGVPRHSLAAYAASKAAATMFTKCLGLELGEYGIRCNIVAPGSTRTPMQEQLWQTGSSEESVIAGSLESFRTGIPLRKIAEPQDVADAVLFLLSDRAAHITMTELYVDGGATLRG